MHETVCAVFVVIMVSFSSFADDHRGGGAGIVVGPRALIVFSCCVTSIRAALLTEVPISLLGSLTTYEVIPLFDTSPMCWGIHLIVVVGCGAHILRPACNTVHMASRSIVAALCLAALCLLYALTWASYWQGLVGARIDEVDSSWARESFCCHRRQWWSA